MLVMEVKVLAGLSYAEDEAKINNNFVNLFDISPFLQSPLSEFKYIEYRGVTNK